MPVAPLTIQANGLLVDVNVGASAAMRALLWRKNRPPPPPVHVTLLVDTGANTTMLSDQIMRTLNLPVRAKSRVHTSTTDAQGAECDVFDVSPTLLPHLLQPRSWEAIEVLSTPLLNHGIAGLLGRDLLQYLVLTYDGPRGEARLVY